MILPAIEQRIAQYAGITPLPIILSEYLTVKDLPQDAELYASIVASFANYYEKVAAAKMYEAEKAEGLEGESEQGKD